MSNINKLYDKHAGSKKVTDIRLPAERVRILMADYAAKSEKKVTIPPALKNISKEILVLPTDRTFAQAVRDMEIGEVAIAQKHKIAALEQIRYRTKYIYSIRRNPNIKDY